MMKKGVKKKLLIVGILVGMIGIFVYYQVLLSSKLSGTAWMAGGVLFEFEEKEVFIIDAATNELDCSGTYTVLEDGKLKLSFEEKSEIFDIPQECSGTYKIDGNQLFLDLDDQSYRYSWIRWEGAKCSEKELSSLEDTMDMISLIFQEFDEEIGEVSEFSMWASLKNNKVYYLNTNLIHTKKHYETFCKMNFNALSEGEWTKAEEGKQLVGIPWEDMKKMLESILKDKQIKKNSSCIHIEKIIPAKEFEEETGTYFSYQDNSLKTIEGIGEVSDFSYVIEITGYEEGIDGRTRDEFVNGGVGDRKYFVVY